jgi:hypothetical protein
LTGNAHRQEFEKQNKYILDGKMSREYPENFKKMVAMAAHPRHKTLKPGLQDLSQEDILAMPYHKVSLNIHVKEIEERVSRQ